VPHAFLIDLTQCAGCGACREACQTVHGFPVRENTRLDDKDFTYLEKRTDRKSGAEISIRRMCQHCVAPACASACPVAALEKKEDGAVAYDVSKCLGCRYCMLACPFDIPKYEWNSITPKVRKCTMCYQERMVPTDGRVDKDGFVLDTHGERVTVDGKHIDVKERDRLVGMTTDGEGRRATACSVACPVGATLFGERQSLLTEALKRIGENPGTYVRRVYGAREAGGTSVLYLSAVPFENLGFETSMGTEALPERTWKVLSKIPDVVTTAGVAFGAIYWITHRREKVRAFEQVNSKRVNGHDQDTEVRS
jgi:formate dehydrogenase iron-sulfur subunit